MDEQRFDDLIEDLKRLQKSFNCRYAGIKQAEGSSPRYKAAKRAALDLNKLCKKHIQIQSDREYIEVLKVKIEGLEDKITLLTTTEWKFKSPKAEGFSQLRSELGGSQAYKVAFPLDWVMANK